jgi:hypothetical protein
MNNQLVGMTSLVRGDLHVGPRRHGQYDACLVPALHVTCLFRIRGRASGRVGRGRILMRLSVELCCNLQSQSLTI